MSDLTDEQREVGARERAARYAGEQLGEAAKDRAALLRLLDAERARAEVAERELAIVVEVSQANANAHMDAERRVRQAEAAANFWANR